MISQSCNFTRQSSPETKVDDQQNFSSINIEIDNIALQGIKVNHNSLLSPLPSSPSRSSTWKSYTVDVLIRTVSFSLSRRQKDDEMGSFEQNEGPGPYL
jgi:hypothetical protein